MALLEAFIRKLPEGFYLATLDDVPGLMAQGEQLQKHHKLFVM